MTLALNLKIKTLIILTFFGFTGNALADPVIAGELTPPGEAAYVTDQEITRKLNLGPPEEPVWCYSNLANSLIISAPDREKERCQLRLQQELEMAKINYDFEIDSLKIQIQSLTKKHDDILAIKNQQINDLTKTAAQRPNDYSVWWATGGVAVGVLTTLSIVFAVN